MKNMKNPVEVIYISVMYHIQIIDFIYGHLLNGYVSIIDNLAV